ncbi:ABC transporter substrate-binding protein [Clostridium sp.]|uniref:ABC transporter substrate-binding protein n=1 Tax=Clostridium sp. TaxID=1506 RepID=UPI00260A5630|nr:extracellular solute-binding protein [uncultured Clostridium sp.]
MKKSIQRIITLGLLTSLLSFTGCANKSSSTSSDTGADKGKVTIKLGIWPEATLTDDIKMHKKFVATLKTTNPEINVVPAYYKYATDTFISLAESGNLPTVFETWYTEPQKLIEGGFVKDITSELKELGWDTAMNPKIKDLLSKDGKIYGIPRDGYSLGLMINVDLFQKAGLVDAKGIPKYPKTWDELAQDAKIIKAKTGAAGLDILAKDNAGGWHYSNLAWAFGAKLEAQKDGRWIAQLNSKEDIAAMNYVKDLKWKYDVLTDDPTNEDWSSGFKALGTGAAAMYIGANDAVNQVTQVNKLNVRKLALVPMPAGPGGQYSLMGGTPYMFSAKDTPEQVKAALKYIEVMGKAPVVTPASIAGLDADAKNKVASGTPVIPSFPAWTSPAFLKAQNDSVKKNSNVDMAMFNDYYKMINKPGNLHTEEPKISQDMYAELTKVLQAVLTDKNADVTKLLGTANSNLQSLLDSQVNK